jgi:hypothetical protein
MTVAALIFAAVAACVALGSHGSQQRARRRQFETDIIGRHVEGPAADAPS